MVATSEIDSEGAPATYGEALRGPEGKGWQIAFDAEVKSLNDNKVYTVVDRPLKKKVVKAKWILRRKLLPGSKLDKLKARIVAKGFTQREGIDYDETFSPTVRFESVRLMVAAAASDGMHTHQMYVTTAFLYASLDEEVYMELMEGMDGFGEPGKVARLWKAIYGLKQASRMWNPHIDGVLASMGFVRLTGDHGVYFKWDGVNRVDASHTSCPDSNKGRAACVFMSGGAPISWASKRVGNGSLSSCETEYMGLTLATQEASFLGELQSEMYRDIGEKKAVVKCIDLITDSQSAKSLVENPVYHGRSKHILAKWHLSYGNESCRIQRDNHVVCRFTNVFVKIGV